MIVKKLFLTFALGKVRIISAAVLPSLGVRFFHYGKKMMFSTFSLNQLSYGNIKNSIDASAGSIDYDIDEDNFAKFKNQDYTFRFGFLY